MEEKTIKKEIIEVFVGKPVVVVYREENISKSVKGIILDWDINFIHVKSDFDERMISTANIEAIKLKKEDSDANE